MVRLGLLNPVRAGRKFLSLVSTLPTSLPSGLLFMHLFRKPLHVTRVVPTAFAQRDDVVHFAVLTARRLRVDSLEPLHGLRVALDLPVAVPSAG